MLFYKSSTGEYSPFYYQPDSIDDITVQPKRYYITFTENFLSDLAIELARDVSQK